MLLCIDLCSALLTALAASNDQSWRTSRPFLALPVATIPQLLLGVNRAASRELLRLNGSLSASVDALADCGLGAKDRLKSAADAHNDHRRQRFSLLIKPSRAQCQTSL
ncbi:MAG: hypothetical protein EAZ30_10415 [Betaproteobacteria bacterium]|nr:MAG: hypothetical protein EAZ30_10415 [Betaproteobacteria bacterium]